MIIFQIILHPFAFLHPRVHAMACESLVRKPHLKSQGNLLIDRLENTCRIMFKLIRNNAQCLENRDIRLALQEIDNKVSTCILKIKLQFICTVDLNL